VLIDLKLDGKTIMVIGGGAESYRKTQNFVDLGAKIWVISKNFSCGIQRLEAEGKISMLKTEIKDAKVFIESLNPKPDIVLAVTDNSKLNFELVVAAKAFCCMVYSVDNPALSDFNFPAVAHIGEVKIAVSTGGKSPAMASVIRERIERLITPQDLLSIQLQEKTRLDLKSRFSEPKKRSKLLYEILNNVNIKEALAKGRLIEAEELAHKLIEKEN
jgi:precorrin-2 dehydrogenase / sirohydrochlorin ferrochelatase